MNINESDIRLIFVLFVIISISFIFISLSKDNTHKKAIVKHNNDIVLTIDLSIDKEYLVKGDQGDVKIVVKDNRIRVEEENSPLHLCSKQGYISESYETIICLPNKISIEIESDDIDAVVR
jgi:hypothetical protein